MLLQWDGRWRQEHPQKSEAWFEYKAANETLSQTGWRQELAAKVVPWLPLMWHSMFTLKHILSRTLTSHTLTCTTVQTAPGHTDTHANSHAHIVHSYILTRWRLHTHTPITLSHAMVQRCHPVTQTLSDYSFPLTRWCRYIEHSVLPGKVENAATV